MPQAEAPRVYKFVGAYSRKRRRRNIAVQPTAASGRTATISPRCELAGQSSNILSRDVLDRPTTHDGMPTVDCAPGSNAIPPTSNASSENTEAATQPLIENFCQVQDPGWPCSNQLDPFFDLELPILRPFQFIDSDHQLPLELDLDGFSTQFGQNCTDSSVHLSQNDETRASCSADETVIETLATDDPSPSPGLQGVSNNVSITVSQLLARYDREFCVMPLTHDFEANPFRIDSKAFRGSQLLLHCILALSYKHINRDTGSYADEARLHKQRALEMFQQLDHLPRNTSTEFSPLDAVLILMTLDCATSGHGPWTWYLTRAHKMIEAAGSSNLKKTPRMEACMEILIWWDVTLALTSRQGCVLSHDSIKTLFSQDRSRDKTFYGVSGCPEFLFLHMIRLGTFAREFEVASGMTCVKLDMDPVLAVEQQIRDWDGSGYELPNLQELSSTENEDSTGVLLHKEDLHHCAEAWRYALLIYISRVFRWRRDHPLPHTLALLARRTLNHVSCCRKSSMVQKQLLLPVFLAGCETTDEVLRQVARKYCTWWNDQTRYDMFLTTHALLEEVWSTEEPQSWWGSVIDRKSRSNVGMGDARQYLFG